MFVLIVGVLFLGFGILWFVCNVIGVDLVGGNFSICVFLGFLGFGCVI